MPSATIISADSPRSRSCGSHTGNCAIENNPSGLSRSEIRVNVFSDTR